MKQTHALLSVAILLLFVWPVGAAAQETRPEDDEDYGEYAVETEHEVECKRIYRILSHPQLGDVMLFGSAGFATSVAWPSGNLYPLKFPIRKDIFAAAFSSDDRLLYLAGTDGLVSEFERGGKKEPRHIYPADPLWADATIRSVDISPNDELLATGGDSGTARIYHLIKNEEMLPFEQTGTKITTLMFSPDSATLAIGDKNGRVHLVDPRNIEAAHTLELHKGEVHGVAFSGDNKRLFTIGEDGKLLAVDIATRTVAKELDFGAGPLRRLDYAPKALDRPLLVAAGLDGRVHVIHGDTLEVLRELPSPRSGVTAMTLNSSGTFLTLAYRGGKVRSVFLYKFLRGDTLPPDWLKNAEPLTAAGAFAMPASRLGLRLTPATMGGVSGLQVTGWLFGFTCPDAPGLGLGDLITHVRYDDGFQPVGGSLDLTPGLEQIAVRYRTAEGKEGEATLPVTSAARSKTIGEVARALLENIDVYEFGFHAFDSGYVHRVYDDTAAAGVGLHTGDMIVSADGRPWREASRDWENYVAVADAVALVVTGAACERTVELSPRMIDPIIRHTLLAKYHALSGDMDEAEEQNQQALEIAEDDWRFYAILVPVLVHAMPEEDVEELVEALRSVIDQAGMKPPVAILDTLAVVLAGQRNHAAVDDLLGDPVAKGDDHRLSLLLATAEAYGGRPDVAVSRLKPLALRGDPQAQLSYGRCLHALGRDQEAVANFRAYYFGDDLSAKIFAADGSPRMTVRGGGPGDPDFKSFVELARKLGLK